MQNRKNFVVYLKALACILITNSHCREIYPISYFAIGGTFGNSLFFILSGYCLANIKDSFFVWYKKRLQRIGISTLIAVVVSFLWIDGFSFYLQKGIKNTILLYVNKYWFAFGIALCYIFFYLLFRYITIERVKKALLTYAVIYVIWYCVNADRTFFWIEPGGFSPFKVYFYFGIMVVGACIRLTEGGWSNANFDDRKRDSLFLFSLIVLSVFIWAVVYMMVTVLQIAFIMQVVIHICVIVFAVSVLRLGTILESGITEVNHSTSYSLVSLISDSTWEIYLVQATFLRFAVVVRFPANWILFWGMAIFGGIIFHMIIKNL